ncbi:MAG: hypothetical protein GY874_05625 [Desulfobacteraceae bacterium]|nr:hypothetical protein [Desulfobacteraceae bacterium]
MPFLLLKSIEQLLSEGFVNKKFREKDLLSDRHTPPGFCVVRKHLTNLFTPSGQFAA